MKKTILIQLIILLAFSTASIAQRSKGSIISASSTTLIASPNNSCTTNFLMGQPTTGTRSIEVTKQGHRNSDGDCVFNVTLFVPSHLEQHLGNQIRWEIDGQPVPGNNRKISVPVPDGTTIVTVNYTIGNQQASASRTFLVD